MGVIVQLYRRTLEQRAAPRRVASHNSWANLYNPAAMSSLLHPLHLLLMMFAGWGQSPSSLDVIDYLQERKTALLKERPGRATHPFSPTPNVDGFARKSVTRLGRKRYWVELETLVTLDTLLRVATGKLVALKWNLYPKRRRARARPGAFMNTNRRSYFFGWRLKIPRGDTRGIRGGG